jgi:hypothetical protein
MKFVEDQHRNTGYIIKLNQILLSKIWMLLWTKKANETIKNLD